MKKEFTDGVLYIICTKLFYSATLVCLFFIAILPFTLIIIFFNPVISTFAIYYFGIIFFQLATSALLATYLKYNREKILRPLTDFIHYYKTNFKDTLRVFFLPNILFLTSIFNFTFLNSSAITQQKNIIMINSMSQIISAFILFGFFTLYLPAALINIKFKLTIANLYKITLFTVFSKPLYTLQVILYLFFIYLLLIIFGDSSFFISVPLVFYIFLLQSLPVLAYIEQLFKDRDIA